MKTNIFEKKNLLDARLFAKPKRIKKTRGEYVFLTVMTIYVWLNCASIIFAFAITVMNSFKDQLEYALGNTWRLPSMGWHFENYARIFSDLEVNGTKFLGMFWNSLWQSVGATLLSMMSTVMASYAYSKYKFPGRKAIYFIVVVLLTLSLPGSGPAYYKLLSDLHLRNSYAYLIVCTGGFGSSFLIFMGFWRGIDNAYAEAAYMDGANEWQVLTKVMFPQVLPMVGVFLINGFVGGWLNTDPSMLYLPEMPSLGYGLWVYQQHSMRSVNYPVYFAALIVVAIPSVIVFLALHEKTIQVMNIGGLKG